MKVFLSINPTKEKKYQKRIKKITTWIQKNLNVVDDYKKSDIIISLGGDGTLLYSINKYMDGYKYFGINLGHLGFLTSTVDTDCREILESVFIDKNYVEEKIYYLNFEYNDKCRTAINDIVLKGKKIQE